MLGASAPGRRRTRGSWIPRLAGVGIVVLLACGGALLYSGSGHRGSPRPRPSQHTGVALSARVVKVQTVGVVEFGPYADGDPAANDPDDHPLMLQHTKAGLSYVAVPAASVASGGIPLWTEDQMADGTDIFIYIPTGSCLSAGGSAGAGSAAAGPGGQDLGLAHCDLDRSQRWRQVHPATVAGQPTFQLQSVPDGDCLTAPAKPGPAALARCGPVRSKTQELAFWWNG